MSAFSLKKLTLLAAMPPQGILMVNVLFTHATLVFDSLSLSPLCCRSSSERLSGFKEEAEQVKKTGRQGPPASG
jgi:hypothetical protein